MDYHRRIISQHRVREITDLSRTTIWRLVRKGRFPAPVKSSEGRTGFYFDEVLAWAEALPRSFQMPTVH